MLGWRKNETIIRTHTHTTSQVVPHACLGGEQVARYAIEVFGGHQFATPGKLAGDARGMQRIQNPNDIIKRTIIQPPPVHLNITHFTLRP